MELDFVVIKQSRLKKSWYETSDAVKQVKVIFFFETNLGDA